MVLTSRFLILQIKLEVVGYVKNQDIVQIIEE